MFDTGARLWRRGSRRRLISGLTGSAVAEEESDVPVLVTKGDLSRSYPAILTICIRSPWERVPLAAGDAHLHGGLGDSAARTNKCIAARKSAIRLSGIVKAYASSAIRALRRVARSSERPGRTRAYQRIVVSTDS